MKRTLVFTLALLGLSTLAFGDTLQILTSRAQQNPNDIIDWSQLGPDSTDIGTPALVSSFNGNLALVGDFGGGDFFRSDSGTSWFGNFDYGETLIWTGNPNPIVGLGGGGPFVIEFQNPVNSFGFQIQADLLGPFTADVFVLDPSNSLLGVGTFNGVSTFATFDGSALFVGMADYVGSVGVNNIGAIIIATDSGSRDWNNDFAIDDVSLYTTPEPGSVALLGSVMLFLGFRLRNRFKKSGSVLEARQ